MSLSRYPLAYPQRVGTLVRVNERVVAYLRRARELDDDEADDVCPGCGGDITGWRGFYCHRRASCHGERVALKAENLNVTWRCEWTRDYLLARQHRRRLLRAAIERGECV